MYFLNVRLDKEHQNKNKETQKEEEWKGGEAVYSICQLLFPQCGLFLPLFIYFLGGKSDLKYSYKVIIILFFNPQVVT